MKGAWGRLPWLLLTIALGAVPVVADQVGQDEKSWQDAPVSQVEQAAQTEPGGQVGRFEQEELAAQTGEFGQAAHIEPAGQFGQAEHSGPVNQANQVGQVLNFGIYAYRPPEVMKWRFGPLADYLSARLPGTRVELKVMSQEALDEAVRTHQVDLVLTNPRHYLQLRTKNHLTGAIATLVKRAFDGSPTRSLGGVIFTQAGRDDLASLADLAGQRIAIPGDYHTGGYMAQIHEIEQAGLPPPDPGQFQVAGSHDAVVSQVLNGAADIGFIRTEVLEELAANGALDFAAIKVINRQRLGDYPFLSSTRLYPEWPLVALSGIDERTSRLVTAALLTLDPEGPVAAQAQIVGFDPPADYLPIEQAVRALRLPPFDQPPRYDLADLWRDYWLQLNVALLSVVTILVLSLLLFLRNRLLEQRGRDLHASQRFLDTLLESIPTPVFCKDLEGRYLRVNPGFERLMGREREKILGKRAAQVAPPELARVYEEQDREVLALGPGGRRHYASRVRNPSGALLEVLFDKAVFTDERGRVAGTIGTVRDVTREKQQEGLIALRMQRDEALLRLPHLAETFEETRFLQRAMELAEDITHSRIAFVHFVNADQDSIELVSWSRRTLDGYCTAVHDCHYPVRQAGIWADALRRRAPVVVNDYPGARCRQGLPEGHAVLECFISVPVIENDRVVMLTGVGNKETDYTETDVESVQLLANAIWRLAQRRRGQRELELAASVFTHAREGILVTAPDGTIVDANEAFSLLTGYARAELVGRNPRLLKSGRQGASFYAEFWRSLRVKGYWRGEIWNRRKDGVERAQLVTISAIQGVGETVSRFVALYSDITEQLDYQHQLERAAHFDALTALPNRVLLADRLRQALARARRGNMKLAVLYLDLDGFKAVNDRYGHAEGDRLLRETASRLRGCLREVDTLARLGGDEFVAVLGDLGTEQDLLPQVNRLLTAVSRPLKVADGVTQLAASIGITFYPQPVEVDPDLLLRQADQAMYQAKLAGRNQYVLFDVDAELDQRDRHRSRDQIQRALDQGELLFHYQPKVNLRRGEVIGAEALLRWAHPERGLLPPGEFLLMGADHQLMIDIGKLAVAHALDEIDAWSAAGRRLKLSVNLHAQHLQRRDLVPWLRDELGRHPGIEPGQLTIEILETSALADLGLVRELILECARIGVELSLDDFGTGYASLTYLRNLPAAEIKIDASFVRGCLEDPEDLAIIEGVLGLATAFQRRVVAEGVETVEHGKMLLALGCELAQGYAIARPMPACELRAWVEQWQAPLAWRELAPVAPADIPALAAIVQHRAWQAHLERIVRDGVETPESSQTPCRFAGWLAGAGRQGYGGQPAFLVIERLHDQAHALAEALLAGVRRKDQTAAEQALGALRALHDQLTEQVFQLLQPGRPR